jgi:hypothetical protein
MVRELMETIIIGAIAGAATATGIMGIMPSLGL